MDILKTINCQKPPKPPKYRHTKPLTNWRTARPLTFYCHSGEYYLTTKSLADHFGPSEQIVRRHLRGADLMGSAERLANTPVFPPATWAALKLALVDRITTQPSPEQLEEAAQYMNEQVWKWARALERLNAVN